jgi:hypothetical protein
MSSGSAVPGTIDVFVIRGIGRWAYDWRRPFEVDAARSFPAQNRSYSIPTRTPSSNSTVRSAGVPSSSTANEPHAPGTEASSTPVTSGDPSRSPISPR